MKKIVSLALIGALLAMASIAFAAGPIQTKALFTAKDATGTSSVVNTGVNTRKTVVINGLYSAGVYGNYSGTVLLEGAPTAAGPWVTLKDKSGNAVSATANTIFNLDDLAQYIRASYTKSKHMVSVWLYYAP